MRAIDFLFANQAALAAQQAEQAQAAQPQQRGAASRPSARGDYTYRHTHCPMQQPATPKIFTRLLRRPPNPLPPASSSAQQEDVQHPEQHEQHLQGHHAIQTAKRTTARRSPVARQPDPAEGPQVDFMAMLAPDVDDEDEDEDEDDDHVSLSVPMRRPQPPATQLLARCGVPEAAALFVRQRPGPPEPEEQMQALASTLLGAARLRTAKREPGQASHTATVLAATQVCLASQANARTDPMTLGQVKALLMEQAPNPGILPAGPDRSLKQNSMLLLPLQILHATRPRTEQQRKQADDRLELLRHAMSR